MATAGGGIWCNYASPTLRNNTIYGNSALAIGGGIYGEYLSDPKIYDTIVWGNSAPSSPGIYIDSGDPTIQHCDVEGGYPGAGNIDADPLFVDPASLDFHLSQDPAQPGVINPCVDGGSNLAENLCLHSVSTRSDGGGDTGMTDMGAHYGAFVPATLETDGFEISVATGATVNLTLVGGPNNGGRYFLVLGTLSGTAPGLPLPGGLAVLPIHWDGFTDFMVLRLNTTLFSNFLGVLDGSGRAAAAIHAPALSPSKIGKVMHYAFCLEGLPDWDFASNPVTIGFTP